MFSTDKVLAHIDANLDNSLERLFALLRIKSISADPHYKQDCREAAEWCAKDLSGIGIPSTVRDTIGHPMVVGHYRGAPAGAPHILFYGHTMSSRSICRVWGATPSTAVIEVKGEKHIRRAARGLKGQTRHGGGASFSG